MKKVVRLQESDIFRLVNKVLSEQDDQLQGQSQMQQLRTTQQGQRQDLRQQQRTQRQDVRQQQRTERRDERAETNAIYEIVKLKRQFSNDLQNLKNAITKYGKTETMSPFVQTMNQVSQQIQGLIEATKDVVIPQDTSGYEQ
jgi:hypothetical protein